MKFQNIIPTALLVTTAMTAQAETGPLVLKSPLEYQVIALSPNGQWACGMYVDYSYQTFAFRWNLQTNQTELLSLSKESEAYSISDNGVVAGSFHDTQATGNGASVLTAGYWKDGAWHHLEMPESAGGTMAGGQGWDISPDGRFMCGSITLRGQYTPMIWKDGQIYKVLEERFQGIPYAMTSDGETAAGWSYTAASPGARIATLWENGKSVAYLGDTTKGAPWKSGRRFSSNDSLLLVWGGWEYDGQGKPIMNAIYHMQTGEMTKIEPVCAGEFPFSFDFYDITNSGTIVGKEQNVNWQEHAFIYKDGKSQFLEDYLKERGFSFDGYVPMDDDYSGYHMVPRCYAINDAEDMFVVTYYDKDFNAGSMVIMLNQELTTREPINLQCRQEKGLNSLFLSWDEPLANASGVKGYNVYRSGVKINDELITTRQYHDNGLATGSYTYTVTAVYDEGESKASLPVEAEIAPAKVNAPYGLTARQKGYNNLLFSWSAPETNLISKSYYDRKEPNVVNFGGGEYSFEAAIIFQHEEVSIYQGCTISSVSFWPLSNQDWNINIYSRTIADADTTYTLLGQQPVTQALTLGQENRVMFDAPVAIPAQGDLVIAVEAKVKNASYSVLGASYGKCVAGYSDLVRLVSVADDEEDFFSLYDASKGSGDTYKISWAFEAIISTPDQSGVTDDVKSYHLTLDGVEKPSVETTHCVLSNLTDGTHRLGVAAEYANGEVSDTQWIDATVSTQGKQRPAVRPTVSRADQATVVASWTTPTDVDKTHITYSKGRVSDQGVKGPESMNYGYIVSSEYTYNLFQGYDGYQIKAFTFYPTGDAIFTFYLYQDDDIIAELEVEDFKVNQWNEIALPQAIALNPNANYNLMIDISDPEYGTYVMGIDDQAAFTGYSNLFSADNGDSYDDLSINGITGNWMMGMVIEDAAPMAMPYVDYLLNIDAKETAAKITEAHGTYTGTYTFNNPDAESHTLSVTALCEPSDNTEAFINVPGEVVTFKLADLEASLREVQSLSYRIAQDAQTLCVEGAGIQSLALCNLQGARVAAAAGRSLNIAGCPVGVYVLQIKTDMKTYSVKVVKK